MWMRKWREGEMELGGDRTKIEVNLQPAAATTKKTMTSNTSNIELKTIIKLIIIVTIHR